MQKMMRLSLLIVYLSISIIASGCGFKDIDKRYFAVGMGIDLTDNEEKPYRITLKLGVPSIEIDAGKSKTQIEIIETSNIAEGLRLLKAQVDKEIDFGHCNVFILGESLARSNIAEAVNWMTRRRDIQKVAAIGIGRPDAESVVKVQPVIERFPGNALGLFFSNDATESSYTFIELLTDLFRRLNEKGLDPILPVVMVQKDATYIVNRVALLDKEKISIVLEPDETQLLIQLLAYLKKANLYGGFYSPPFAIAIQTIRTKYNFQQNGPALHLNMNIKQAITFDEMPTDAYFNDPEKTISQLETAYSEAVKQLLVKIQEANVDPLGFGLRYRAKYHLHDFEQEWPDIYQSIKFDVSTTMSVHGTGLLK